MAEPQGKLLTDIVLDEVTVCKEPANDDCRADIVKSRNEPQRKTLVETDMTDVNLQDQDDEIVEFELSEEDADALAKEIEELNEAGELIPAFAALLDQAEMADEAIGKMLEEFEALEGEHEELKKSAGLLADRVEKMARDGAAGKEDESIVQAIRKSMGGTALDEHTALRIEALEAVAKDAEAEKAIAKAKELGFREAAKVGPALIAIRKRCGDDVANLIEAEMKAANAIISKSAVFSPIGVSAAVDADSPIAKARGLADDLRKANPKLTDVEARALVWEQNPELYAAHQAEQRRAR